MVCGQALRPGVTCITWRTLSLRDIDIQSASWPTHPEYTFSHPNGLLFATQFVQIALVVTEKAAFEDMRMEALFRMCLRRPPAWRRAVERDAENHSNYAMCPEDRYHDIAKSLTETFIVEKVKEMLGATSSSFASQRRRSVKRSKATKAVATLSFVAAAEKGVPLCQHLADSAGVNVNPSFVLLPRVQRYQQWIVCWEQACVPRV
ncbi:hypothetical protein HGRIS_006551 [Hohenbuehelia grisea]|uniref:Uncharacterized protein n=1 Tax=Hohenbuehelia grisea TaxID=104357 RepID=A0ABR3J9A0_9AGAR